MNMIEFRITSDLQELRKQSISANFDETKAWLTENLEPLRTMAVTPESMSQSKQYRAAIRRVRDRIDESRKLAKAAAMEAYSDFEAKCKELTALCDEAANALNVQIKAMENAVKEEKRMRLIDYFAKIVGDMAEWISFDDCFNPKWLNATYAESTAQADMCAAVDRCRADLNAIRALGSEFETELLAEYRTTRNIGAVLMKNNILTRLKAEEDERKRRESEAKKEQRFKMYAMPPEMVGQQAGAGSVNELVDEDGQKLSEAPSVADVIRSTEREALEHAATENDMICTVDFRVYGTVRQLDGLKKYMETNGIRYGRVPQE